MKYRVNIKFGSQKVGDEIELSEHLADALLKKGVLSKVEEKKVLRKKVGKPSEENIKTK